MSGNDVTIWVFPKIGVYTPKSSHFNRGFLHYFQHHPFLVGKIPLFLVQHPYVSTFPYHLPTQNGDASKPPTHTWVSPVASSRRAARFAGLKSIDDWYIHDVFLMIYKYNIQHILIKLPCFLCYTSFYIYQNWLHDIIFSPKSPSFGRSIIASCAKRFGSPATFEQFFTWCIYMNKDLYTWNPNDPCFDWKRLSFGGFKPQNRGQTCSRYIYIYISLSLSPSLYGTGRSLSALWACRGWQGGSEGIRVEFAKLEKIGEVHVEELVATVRGRAHRKNLQMLVNGIRSRLPTSTIFQGRLGPVPG